MEARDRPESVQDRRQRLNERLRAEFIAGAEEDSRRRLGRGLTAEEPDISARGRCHEDASDPKHRTPEATKQCAVHLETIRLGPDTMATSSSGELAHQAR